jgi:hypothetical protein
VDVVMYPDLDLMPSIFALPYVELVDRRDFGWPHCRNALVSQPSACQYLSVCAWQSC